VPRIDDWQATAASALRRISWFPGHTRLRRAANSWLLARGADPVVLAPLQDGAQIRVDLRTLTQRDVPYVGHYDRELVSLCSRLLPDRPTVLDVGANVGFYAVLLGAVARRSGGRVIAFEPLSTNVDRLRENLALNGLDDVVRVFAVGLSSSDGSASITLREDFSGGATTGNAAIVIDDGTDHRFRQETIQLRTLDGIREEAGVERVDLVKLDIEGHEDHFLEGARATLEASRPVILMEVNKPYYARRKVDLDAQLAQSLSVAYRGLRSERGRYRRWKVLESTSECQRVDNVFLVPEERCSEVLNTLNATARG
jgi:FkbM family methyltransferase